MPKSSFVSWQSADLPWVQKFVSHLREFGLPIFWSGDGIEKGALWPLWIDRGMTDAEFFLPVFTPEYFNSRACEVELGAALAAEMSSRRSYLLPVLLRSTRLPMLLAPFQYVDMRDPFRYAEGLKAVVTRISPEAAERFVVLTRTPPGQSGEWVTAHGPAEYDWEGDAYERIRQDLEDRLAEMSADDPARAEVERKLDAICDQIELHEDLKEEYR